MTTASVAAAMVVSAHLLAMPAPHTPTSPSPPAPSTRRDQVVETLHGVKVADPYRWLEDEAASEVVAWTAAQNAYTRTLLDALPGRAQLEARLWSLHEIGSLGAPVPRPMRGGHGTVWRYFYTRRDGQQNQPVLYVRDRLRGHDRVLLDVNLLAADGTLSLDWWVPSENGRLVAYGLSPNGSEESVLRVRDVKTGRDWPDTISRTRMCSLAWLPDGSGFYYTRYPAPGSVPAGEESYHRRVFLHKLGNATGDDDPPVFGAGRDLKDWPSVALSPDGRFLGLEISQGWSKSELYVLDRLAGPSGTVMPIVVGTEANFELAELTNEALFIRTNDGAPRYRLFRVTLKRNAATRVGPSPAAGQHPTTGATTGVEAGLHNRTTWREIIPQGPHTLQQVAVMGGRLAALYLDNAASRISLFDLDARARAGDPSVATGVGRAVPSGQVILPAVGTVAGIYAHPRGNEMFLPFTSFLHPTAILRQSLVGASRRRSSQDSREPKSPRQSAVVERPSSPPSPASASGTDPAPSVPQVWLQIPSPVPADSFVVTADSFASKDGTQIPLFLVHRRNLVRDGTTPTVLYGYGGFNVNITPTWVPAIVPFIEKGGVYAVAVLRGGGELGETWHQDGMLARKQNVFDDFIAAATHLTTTAKITSPARLAIVGRSNGGLLVGAALTQRPDLFRAAISGVPLLDMLRYHKFRIAQLWIPEYGSADDPKAFAWLHAYSPYHRVRDGVAYPAVMFVTAASDTRVDPLHARKMTARLQAATSSRFPILLRLETQAGHGAGKPLGKVITQLVDEWSFLFAALGLH